MCGSSRKRTMKKKALKGGMGYGFGGTIGTAGPVWNSSWGGEVTKSGTPIYDTAARPSVTGGRRRKSKKGGRKSKKTRKMRGGAQWQSVSTAGGSFTGSGDKGLINLTPYAVNVPGGGPTQNADGAYRA